MEVIRFSRSCPFSSSKMRAIVQEANLQCNGAAVECSSSTVFGKGALRKAAVTSREAMEKSEDEALHMTTQYLNMAASKSVVEVLPYVSDLLKGRMPLS